MNKGKLFVLSAPSGAGKSTILRHVLKNIEGVAFSISHTTRQPRQGETDGVEYHFVDRPSFEEMIDAGDFLEYAEVHGNYYGTSRAAVQQQEARGVDVILDIDVQGARIVRGRGDTDGVYIFLAPPDLAELEKRLRGRGLDSEETISVRLKNAEAEMTAMTEFDYLIVNEKVDDAVRMFESVILAERSRAKRGVDGKPLTLQGNL